VIASAQWSICLLQESPPAWAPRLAARTGGAYHCVLTARNQLAPLTRRLARWNPDLVGSWEGGSNLTLVRPDWKIVASSERSLLLNPLLNRRLRERRRMSFVRVRSKNEELCVGNLHASHYDRRRAEEDVWCAAVKAVAWAGDDPLILGGDFNLRPRTTTLFDRLERELGLSGATADDAIDHILARGLELASGPIRWPDERREVEVPSNSARRRLRLSDHNPVEATFRCY
jgi:endonuclease/exonuclease/phosphatase family metal-dependent hydrolase